MGRERTEFVPYESARRRARIDYKTVQATFTYQNMDFENDAAGSPEPGMKSAVSSTRLP